MKATKDQLTAFYTLLEEDSKFKELFENNSTYDEIISYLRDRTWLYFNTWLDPSPNPYNRALQLFTCTNTFSDIIKRPKLKSLSDFSGGVVAHLKD